MKSRLFLFAVCASAVCFLQAEPLDVSGFSKSLTITVPDASVAQGVLLTDFPALVRLSTAINGFSYSDFQQQNGADLAFLDSHGNVLSHEVDTWNEQGESLVWVKIPAFSRSTRIYVVYGSAGYSSSVSPTNTWSDFTGVWHMKEASGTVADATGHGLTATPSGTRAEYNVGISGGVIGMARQNGGNGNFDEKAYLSIPNYDSYNLGDTFTASGFFRVTAAGGWYRLFSRKTSSGGWGQETHSERAYQVYAYGAPSAMPYVEVDSKIVGNWMHLAFVYSGSSCKVYADGQLVNTLGITPASDNGAPLSIGCTSDGGDWSLYGDYDEARLCDGELSAERIAADYATATDAGFLSYGAAEACTLDFTTGVKVNPSDFSKFVQITASASAVPSGGVIEGFPALVRLSENISGFHYSDFMANGADLVFADEDGIMLDSEIDTWNTSGESLVWVKVPTFRNGMSLYAYWGSGSASPLESTNTWSDFTGVWHMNESGSTAEPDVSGNGLDATPNGSDTSEMATVSNGAVGKARINQSTQGAGAKNCLYVPSYPALGNTFTASGWFNASYKEGWHRLISRKTQYGTDGWEVEMRNGSDEIDAYGSGEANVRTVVSDLQGSWNHLAVVYCGTTVYVYQNGVQIASGSITAVEDFNDRRLGIGNNAVCGERSFVGSYDEVRLGPGALPAQRIAADYATVTNAAFFSYGAVGVPAVDPPAFIAPAIANDAGALKISVTMLSGTGTPYVRFTSDSGSTDLALSETAVTGPQSYSVAVPGTLASGKTYSFAAVGVNTAGGEIVVPGEGSFYVGSLVAAKVSDAAEDGLVAGGFSITRADSHGDLAVNYALSGTAVAGTDYEGAASGTVTIPDGSTSATVSITPKANAAVNADTTVVLSIAEGLYGAQESTATMTIVNLAPVTRKNFRKRIEFTFPMDFLGEGEVLTNFPALVKLSTAIPGFSYSDFQLANGGDLMFTDSRGRAIPSEVDTWEDTGTSLVWVTIPELTKGTVVKMYYGNGANPAGVPLAKWPDYAGVWHMREASGTAYDSAANGFDAVAVQNARSRSTDLVAVADGAVGAGRFNQDGTTYYDVGTYDAEIIATARRNYLSVPSGIDNGLGTQISFSGWFRTIGGTEWVERMAGKRAPGYNYGWAIERKQTTGEADVTVGVYVADGGKEFSIPNMRNNWVHVFVSFDKEETGDSNNPWKSVASVYANGVLLGTTSGSTRIHENDYPLTFGNINSTTDGFSFYGQYDELRLKRGTSSANWAKAEYRTVTDASFASASGAMPAVGGLMIMVR
ncbi:MAG: DUF2341 domain-containing protein [Kiritimatiellae bacterium]|nr:DUF2341 domain-containing protein [Kiritimatiellia bacterium]